MLPLHSLMVDANKMELIAHSVEEIAAIAKVASK